MDNMNQMNQYSFDSSYADSRLTLNQYISRTFGWMFVGLMVTFLLAWAMSASGAVFYLFYAVPQIAIILLIAEVAVVLIFSARIHKNSVWVSRILFLVYSVLNGVVFSVYFVLFEVTSLIAIFGLTALFFGAFALYGRFTKTDLSRLRPLLVGGLIFLLVAALLSFFIRMEATERIICMVGIVVFLCFTAYDTQKIKANYNYFYHDAVMLHKASIYSALELYLDFINLFLYLLRFMGRSKN
ncbi:MAG TPA: Bax inhibitor-1/YccA family protein [Candidatus Enterenecus stercoripullorum]|nr:Bax inhibitor-1/YccA family protein [Candidatus Enterenecus stercoripullorum]